MEFLALPLIALGGAYLTDYKTRGPTEFEMNAHAQYSSELADKYQVGIATGTIRNTGLGIAELNAAFVPRTAPRQQPTYDVTDIYKDQANTGTYYRINGVPFFFRNGGEISLTSALQSNPNVEIPSNESSIWNDERQTLLYYPRVYTDQYKNERGFWRYANEPGTMNAGEPTEWEEKWVPTEGLIGYLFNPWGPGGDVQNIRTKNQEKLTRKNNCNRSNLMRPPYNSQLW